MKDAVRLAYFLSLVFAFRNFCLTLLNIFVRNFFSPESRRDVRLADGEELGHKAEWWKDCTVPRC